VIGSFGGPCVARKTKSKGNDAKTATIVDLAAFDIRDDDLPDKIDEGALASGGFPYPDKFDRDAYDDLLPKLQIELLKLQTWAIAEKRRVVVVFEGRDGAGKGGAIARFTQHMNPRTARVVALSKPTDAERGQWYFQRYAAHMPTAGEIVLFDRSWYNRAMVEPVNGFCTPEQTEIFLREAPAFERMLVRDGVHLVKIFLDIGREMQLKRLWKRHHDPLKRWKLSPIDYGAAKQWEAYSAAIERMFTATHVDEAPWTVIMGNDKLRARISALRLVLARIDYAEKSKKVVGTLDRRIVGVGGRFFDQDA
jgi:polyphosphate kinase